MMVVFILLALTLTAVCLLLVLRPLLRQQVSDASEKTDDLVAVYRDKLIKLKRQLDEEEIDNDQYQLAKQELEVALACELPANEQADKHGYSNVGTGWIIAIGVPVTAIALYLAFGTPKALSPEFLHAESGSPQSIDAMTSELKQKLAANPDNLQGWLLLGRSYAALAQEEKSSQAFARATQLAPDDADVLLDYAESIARLRNDSFAGEPEQIIDRALLLDPDSLRGRILKGIVFFQQDQREHALAVWQPLYLDQTNTQEERELVGQLIQAASGTLPDTADPATASITVTIALDDRFRDDVSPQDTLFIYARAASGPPMPLAIERHTAQVLPITITLDDSDSMLEQMTLSRFEQVIVNARISKNGSATPQSGDIQGSSPVLNPATQPAISINIDQVLP
jgi:cytochrome c-type biogenesis protein CcmH